MAPLTVVLAPDAPSRYRDAAATFPRSFRVADGGSAPPASARIIRGDAGWTDRVRGLLEGGSRAVLVGDPVCESVRDLRTHAARVGALVMLAPPGSHDPGISVARTGMDAAGGSLLECRVLAASSFSPSTTMMAALQLIRSVDSPVVTLDIHSRDRHGLHATGTLESGRDVVLAIDVCDAVPPLARLRVISSRGLIEADIPLTERTRPSTVRDVSAAGESRAASGYLSASRAALMRFHSAIGQPPDLSELNAFHRDHTLVGGLRWD